MRVWGRLGVIARERDRPRRGLAGASVEAAVRASREPTEGTVFEDAVVENAGAEVVEA